MASESSRVSALADMLCKMTGATAIVGRVVAGPAKPTSGSNSEAKASERGFLIISARVKGVGVVRLFLQERLHDWRPRAPRELAQREMLSCSEASRCGSAGSTVKVIDIEWPCAPFTVTVSDVGVASSTVASSSFPLSA